MSSRLVFTRDAEGYLYRVGEQVLAFHYKMLYDAKVLLREMRMTPRGNQPFYKIHYQSLIQQSKTKGWKDRYDEWAEEDRLMKRSEENKQMQREIKIVRDQQKKVEADKKKKKAASAKKLIPANGTNDGSEKKRKVSDDQLPDNERRETSTLAAKPKLSNPSLHDKEGVRFDPVKTVSITVPPLLSRKLLEGHEHVIQKMLVNLPSKITAAEILQKYKSEISEKGHLYETVISDLHVLFTITVGRMLLYRFERKQYATVLEQFPRSNVADIYGADHLLRMLAQLPELLLLTEMDDDKRKLVCDVANGLLNFLNTNIQLFDASNWITPGSKYVAD